MKASESSTTVYSRKLRIGIGSDDQANLDLSPTLTVNGASVTVDPATMIAGPKHIHNGVGFFGALEAPLLSPK